MREKFFVLSLPRSRSKWLSEFLSFGGRVCGHDMIVDCASQEDFEQAVDGVDGTCETGAMLGWKVLRSRWPDAKLVTIHRPVHEVYNSFLRFGLQVNVEDLILKEQMLLACSQSPGVLSVTFDQLRSFDVCGAIFAHCLDLGLDYDYWAELSSRNIQVNMEERVQVLRANSVALGHFRDSIMARQQGSQSWGLN